MSMRQTEEIAEEASRFSIRSFFPMSMTMRSQVADVPYAQPQMQPQPQPQPQPQIQAAPPQLSLPLQQPQPQPQPQSQPQLPARSLLRFNLPLQQTAAAAAAPAQQDPFKFALPAAVHEPLPPPTMAAAMTMTAASAPVAPPNASSPVAAHAPGGIPGMAAVRTIPVEAHEAEIARVAVANNELTERLKLSESKLARTEASVVRGNQALATERVQYKQKIISLSEEMDTLRANEKRAVEELGLRADDSAELSKLKLEMKTLHEQRKSAAEATAAEYASLSGDYMELSDAKDALQQEAATYIKSIGEKEAVISAMAVELDAARRTAASAEAQIDELDAKLAKLRVEQIFESPAPAATGMVIPTGDELQKAVTAYIMKNYKSFKMDEHNHIRPGDRVMDRETGRLATVQGYEDGKEMLSGAYHPAVRYDDDPSVLSTEHNKSHFIVITDEKSLPRPVWEPEYGIPLGMTSTPAAAPAVAESSWTIAEREAEVEAEAVAATPATELAPVVVRLTTCCGAHETSKQAAAEAEAKAARGHLAKHLHDRCCTMGVHRADDPLAPDLHAYVETGAPGDALRAAQIANPAANTDAAVRTATYVAAVSEDIKKRMTGQREQWAKAVQIGAAA